PARVWQRRVRGLVARSGLTDAAVRLTVTRGTAGEALAPERPTRPTLLLTVRRLPAYLARRQREGVPVVLLPFPRDAGPPWAGLKLVGHASAVAGRVIASRRGAAEGLYVTPRWARRRGTPAQPLTRLAPGGTGIPSADGGGGQGAPGRGCGDEAAEPALRRQTGGGFARRDGGREPAAPRARARQPDGPGCGRHHRRGHLRADRARRARQGRARPDPLLRGRGDRLRIRGPLLRRVRVHGAGRGQRVHLRLCHARRAVRVDHRLGPGARVRRRLEHRGARLVAIPPSAAEHLRRD